MGIRKKKSLMDQATEYAESVRPQFEAAVAEAREKAAPYLAEAREKAVPLLVDARQKAVDYTTDARDKAGPKLAEARDKAAPYLAEGKVMAAETALAGAALAAEKANLVEGLAAAKVADLKAEPGKKKGSKLKKIALFAGLAAVAAVVARKLTGNAGGDNWQSSYTPAPAPTPARAAAPTAPAGAETNDSAGATPDEALADATDTPHAVTTPDEPAEVINIADAGNHKD